MLPSTFHLLLAPFRGPAAAVEAAAVGPARSLLAFGLALLLLAVPLAAHKYLELSAELASLRESPLWLMPRLNIENGRAWTEGGDGRVLSLDTRVIVFDTRLDFPELEPAKPGDLRTRWVVRGDALLIYSHDRPVADPWPWALLNDVAGPVSVDGPELIDFLDESLFSLLLAYTGFFGVAITAWWLLVLVLAALTYRLAFRRAARTARFGALFAAACSAAIPVAGALTLLRILGLRDGPLLGLQLLGFGLFFLAVASRLRLADPGRSSAPLDVG